MNSSGIQKSLKASPGLSSRGCIAHSRNETYIEIVSAYRKGTLISFHATRVLISVFYYLRLLVSCFVSPDLLTC